MENYRFGQVAIAVNGELCPQGESQSPQVPIVQRVFELEGGPATGLPWATQHPSAAAVLCEASMYLFDLAKKLGVEDEFIVCIGPRVAEPLGPRAPQDA